MNGNDIQHLSAERLQAFLDGELPDRDDAAVRAHVDGCVRCRSELDAWETLFEDLSELPALAPSATFRDRILEARPQPVGAAARVRGWLGLDTSESRAQHVGSARLQDYMDGRLAARTAARVDAHLDACAVCRGELQDFRQVARSIERLPRLAPAEGFSERVLAGLRIGQLAAAAMAPTTRTERLAAWVRRAVPATPRGWAAAMGVAVAPVVTLVLMVQAVFSHPLVTVGNLAAFGWLKLSGLVARATQAIAGPLAENTTLVQVWTFVEQALQSSTVAAATAAGLSGLTMAALWILYRNVFASHPEDQGYAQLSV